MKKTWERVYGLITEVGCPGETVTACNFDSEVVMHYYKIGNDQWLTIWEDCDVEDSWEGEESEHISQVNLNGEALEALYKKLKQIFE